MNNTYVGRHSRCTLEKEEKVKTNTNKTNWIIHMMDTEDVY